MSMIKKWRKVIPKKCESKYVSALPKSLNEPSLLTWRSAMSSIIIGPFRLFSNTHLFRWPVSVDMWCPEQAEVRIRRQVREKMWRISNLLKTFEVQTLSNSNANFVTSPLTSHSFRATVSYWSKSRLRHIPLSQCTRWRWPLMSRLMDLILPKTSLCYLPVKMASSYIYSFWHNTGVWQTDRHKCYS